MKKTALLLTFTASLLYSLPSTASSSDFPSACEIDASGERESQKSKHMEKFERFSLGTLHSMADSCAFGDRIQGMIDGALSSIFSEIADALNFDDDDFFCGFGTKDIWQQATSGTGAQGTFNFNSWRSRELREAQRDVSSYQRDWVYKSTRTEGGPNELNVFDMIFAPDRSRANMEDSDSDNDGWF